MKLKILTGLPASGKSTWAKEFCHTNKDWIRVNRDDLRNMRGDYWIPKQEKLITAMEDACISQALSMGYNVVLDATNLNKDRNHSRVRELKSIFKELLVQHKHFDTSVEECIKRDLKRPNSVGEKVIRDMHDKYLAPTPVVYEEDELLPKCVIFDVDGTLAEMNGRSPYEWDRVGEDKVNEPVADLARRLVEFDLHIIIFTGRDGVCLGETVKWLRKNGILFSAIHIRPEGNQEKDSIIKKRMFEENIRGKYYCEMVIDDRDQVVEMWRKELGLTCLQVNYGNF